MSLMEWYWKTPVWMQNLALSAYGVMLKRRRYGGIHQQTVRELERSERLDGAALARLQLERLNAQLANAGQSEFYRARKLPGQVNDLRALAELPRVTKSELRTAGRTVVPSRFQADKLLEIHTGGTTGTPLAVYCDRATLQRNYAYFVRFKRWAGVSESDRTATFAGRTIVPPSTSKPPFWRRNAVMRTMLCSSYHLGGANTEAYIAALEEFGPQLIDAYPSAIETLSRAVLARGGSRIRPKAVITSSETLWPEVRARAEEAFGCKVFDHYGAAEMAAFITQCSAGSYHPNPEFGIVEIVRPDGAAAAPGEAGEMIATGFINPVMPLIRYVTGDTAIAGPAERCACGSHFPRIERIEGRMDDVIITPDGRQVGRLDPIFKAVSALHETRIVQDERDHVRVEVVTDDPPPTEDLAVLRKELAARLGPEMRIDIVRLAQLERTRGGKLRSVVNLVYPSGRPTN